MKTVVLENGSKKKCHLRTAREAESWQCAEPPSERHSSEHWMLSASKFSPAEMGLNVGQTSGFLNAFAFKMTSKQKMIFSFLRLLLIRLDQRIWYLNQEFQELLEALATTQAILFYLCLRNGSLDLCTIPKFASKNMYMYSYRYWYAHPEIKWSESCSAVSDPLQSYGL